jgi:hypothetical protein
MELRHAKYQPKTALMTAVRSARKGESSPAELVQLALPCRHERGGDQGDGEAEREEADNQESERPKVEQKRDRV